MTTIDLIVIGAYLVFLAALGPIFSRFNRDASDYFRAGGAMVWWMAAASVIMANFSAWVYTGGAARVYETGMLFLVLPLANFIADLVSWRWVAPWFRQMRVVTVAEAVRLRYGPANEWIFTVIQVPLRLLQAAVALYTLAVFASTAFPWNLPGLGPLGQEGIIVVLGAMVLVMAVVGGSWAINAGQFVQGLLLLLVTACLAIFTLLHPRIDGLGGLLRQLPDAHLSWNGFDRWGVLAVFGLTLVANQVIQRNSFHDGGVKYLIVRDGRDARRVALATMLSAWVLTPLWLIPPLGALVLHPQLDSLIAIRNPAEGAYILMAQSLLPAGLLGLMICAIFSASLDSFTTNINVAAGIAVRTLYFSWRGGVVPERAQVRLGRVLTMLGGVAVVVLAILISRHSGLDLYRLLLLSAAAIGIPQAVPLFFGLFVRKAPDWAMWSTMLLGFSAALGLTLPGSPLTEDRIRALWAGFDPAPLTRVELGDVRVGLVTGLLLTLCVGWYFLAVWMGRNQPQSELAGRFFRDTRTPLTLEEASPFSDSDAPEGRLIGRVCLWFGVLLGLLAFLPNDPLGQAGLAITGLLIALVGVLIGRMARAGETASSS